MTVTGLRNTGNSCYLNASLQLLYSSNEVKRYLSNSRGSLPSALSSLFRAMKDSAHPIDPLPYICGGQAALNGDEQDAHEFLMALLDRLSVAASQLANPTPSIIDMGMLACYQGMVHERILCLSCSSLLSLHLLPTPIISLEIARSIQLSLNMWLNTGEKLDGYRCSKCNSISTCHRRQQLVKAPNVLIIHFNRIKIGASGLYKDPTRLTPDLTLTLSGRMYKLRSFIQHSGTVLAGHYVCIRPTPKGFIMISDSQVIPTTNTSEPYILLYEAIQ